MSTATPQKFEFQAEIKQLLDIVIHSLYTEKEIFVRELVSNASDAIEKLRHLQLTEKEIADDKLELEINLTTDDKAKTLTIQDTGIGMTRAELIENLGTIAHSGCFSSTWPHGSGCPKCAASSTVIQAWTESPRRRARNCSRSSGSKLRGRRSRRGLRGASADL